MLSDGLPFLSPIEAPSSINGPRTPLVVPTRPTSPPIQDGPDSPHLGHISPSAVSLPPSPTPTTFTASIAAASASATSAAAAATPTSALAPPRAPTECDGESCIGPLSKGDNQADHRQGFCGDGTMMDDVEAPSNAPARAANSDMDVDPPKHQLNLYRERLARDQTARGGKLRVSPIQEESARSPPPSSAALACEPNTSSTESGHTIRGTPLPDSISTPSYPFPRVGVAWPAQSAHPLSQGRYLNFSGFPVQDRVMSTSSSTPASALTFQPGAPSQMVQGCDYPTPNLYDLTLMLSAEPGVEAWWDVIVQIMTELYKAERVSLAVPGDATDIENVPWGQRATWCAYSDDNMSNGYMAKGDGPLPSSTEEETETMEPFRIPPITTPLSQVPRRPGLNSRHSFTKFENHKGASAPYASCSQPLRPSLLSRSKSYYPPTQPKEQDPAANVANLNKEALQVHDALEPSREPIWEGLDDPHTQRNLPRVYKRVQGLDLEADPLIDNTGVARVLQRGKTITLTRTYPYLKTGPQEDQDGDGPKPVIRGEEKRKFKKSRSDSSNKLSSILGSAANLKSRRASIEQAIVEDKPETDSPKYEEYEQPPPSPWTQSPAPSPAFRADPSDNPFFRNATVDEDSFNPSDTPEAYGSMGAPQAIGMDNSWSVLHIPLPHVLLSKRNQGGAFKLDPSVLQAKAHVPLEGPSLPPRRQSQFGGGGGMRKKEKHAPIAILSVLSPVIPYPANLRHSLEHLAPHLASTFSLARHHSTLEAAVAGLHNRNGDAPAFGVLVPDRRPLVDPTTLGGEAYLRPEDLVSQQSLGSITSPSECSVAPRSTTASPGLTPGLDSVSASLGSLFEKRTAGISPSPLAVEGYFGPRGPGKSAIVVEMAASNVRVVSKNKVIDPPTTTQSNKLRPPTVDLPRASPQPSPREAQARPCNDQEPRVRQAVSFQHQEAEPTEPEPEPKLDPEPQQKSEQEQEHPSDSTSAAADRTIKEENKQQGGSIGERRPPLKATARRHTQIHSHGADFAATAPSLPPSLLASTMSTPYTGPPVRSTSMYFRNNDLPHPSGTLRPIILDLLPLQIFIAQPQSGEILWVNSRFLSYRGQNISGLEIMSNPYESLHPDDRPEYLDKWQHCVRAGMSLETDTLVRIRRFDGEYRRFAVRAVPIRDKHSVVTHFLGSFVDVHKQHMAEMEAQTKADLETSEAKHRLLANLIPQIIFTATEDEGITFANEQWLSYTGQQFEEALGLGFVDFVHPDDLARCRIPATPTRASRMKPSATDGSDAGAAAFDENTLSPLTTPTVKHRVLNATGSGSGSPCSISALDMLTTDLVELARKGIIKVSTDSSGRQSYMTEVRLRTRNSEYRWHLIRCVEIDTVDFGSGASSYFGSATDINDHKLLETKLKEAMESKSRFLSNMSHEIRTPLIGISGMVSFLQDTPLTEEQRDYTNTIQTSAKSLLLIINDILDLSKVDAGMMKLSFEWFHTRSLIEDVNELVWTMAVSKGLELNYVVEEDVPSWVKGDRVRIRQVLLNVIGNAIKFTTKGEVFSHCRVYSGPMSPVGQNEIMLEFSIIDTGRGFSKDEAELIFKPFSQIDASSTRQHGGSGLGLVISRQLVELHGGQMNGAAVLGQGSTFTFTARFKLPSDDDGPDVSTTPRQIPLRQGLLPLLETESTERAERAELPTISLVANPVVHLGPTDSETTPPTASSGSSGARSPSTTATSSISSVNAGLARFGEAAKASGQDLSQMRLEMPSGKSSPSVTPMPDANEKPFRPRIYSILVVCPRKYSKQAIKMHIEMTVPKDVPTQITSLGSTEEARRLLIGDDPVVFTHIVLNCPTEEEAIGMLDTIMLSPHGLSTTVLLLADSKQRQAIVKATKSSKYEQILAEKRLLLIPKPAKPFRFAAIFDPARERDLSFDYNRSRALEIVENQKQNYVEAEKKMGNKGYKVLLVEDNLVNQKVLLKYLKRIGLSVDVANDGEEATEKVFEQPHGHYAVVLCDLQMPRKDGYQTCEEIRTWENTMGHNKMPIIALSANVMSDVEDKCYGAGFSSYVTKPVDFADLSTAMSQFF